MKSVIFLAMLVACGGDDAAPTPFDREPCGAHWSSDLAYCDRECVAHWDAFHNGSNESEGSGSACAPASRPGSPDTACQHTFTDDTPGCCHIETDGSAGGTVHGMPVSAQVVHFYECP